MEYHEPLERSLIVSGLAALLGVAVAVLGISQVTVAGYPGAFSFWAEPAWLAYPVCALGVIAAILIVTPASRFYGSLLVALIMLSKATFHLVQQQPWWAAASLLAVAFALLVAWWRRPWHAEPTRPEVPEPAGAR